MAINITKTRAIISSLLILLFFAVTITGFGLYLAPIGRIANATNWRFLAMDKHTLEKIHTLTGFAMSFLIMIHLIINYKLFFAEIKSFKKR